MTHFEGPAPANRILAALMSMLTFEEIIAMPLEPKNRAEVARRLANEMEARALAATDSTDIALFAAVAGGLEALSDLVAEKDAKPLAAGYQNIHSEDL